MYSVRFVRSFPPIDMESIKAFKEAFGIDLPEQYENFLLQHNGGTPLPDAFYYYGDGSQALTSDVKVFFGLASYERETLEHAMQTWKSRIPDNLLPIGSTSNGDIIIISCKGNHKGNVYIWKHEFEADKSDGEVPTYENVFLVSNSFHQFLQALTTIE